MFGSCYVQLLNAVKILNLSVKSYTGWGGSEGRRETDIERNVKLAVWMGGGGSGLSYSLGMGNHINRIHCMKFSNIQSN